MSIYIQIIKRNIVFTFLDTFCLLFIIYVSLQLRNVSHTTKIAGNHWLSKEIGEINAPLTAKGHRFLCKYNDLPNFIYVLFHYRRSKIVWPNEKEDTFVLIFNRLLDGSLRFVKRPLYGSFRLSVLSDVAFSIQTYKMQLWGAFWPSKFAGRLVWEHLLTETGLLALPVSHGILKCMYWFPYYTKWCFPQNDSDTRPLSID